MVTIKAPAKINLALDTLYKRDDNYHEVEMIMTTVDLADYITVTPRNDDKIVIQSNEFTIPLNEKNLENILTLSKGLKFILKRKSQ